MQGHWVTLMTLYDSLTVGKTLDSEALPDSAPPLILIDVARVTNELQVWVQYKPRDVRLEKKAPTNVELPERHQQRLRSLESKRVHACT